MTDCVDCGWSLDPEDQIHSTATGRLLARGGEIRCDPCYYRAVHPELEPSHWIISSLAAGFQVLKVAERRRLNAFLRDPDAQLAVGTYLFNRYWVYEGCPKIAVVACQSQLPTARKVREARTCWGDFYTAMNQAVDLNPALDGLSFAVAERDATMAQVRLALRRRSRSGTPVNPLAALFD